MNKDNKILTYILLTLSTVFWGISFILTKELFLTEEHMTVTILITMRLAIATLVMVPLLMLMGKMQRIERRDIKWFLLLAFFEPFLYFIGETFGIKATNSPTLSALIIALIPIVTMFADMLFYKTKLAAIAKLGVLITLPGTLLMVLKKDPSTSVYWWGIALLLLAVFASCSYSITVRKLVDKYSALTINTWQFCIGSVFFLPFFLLAKGDFPLVSLFRAPAVGPLLFLAILCSCGAFSCYVFAIKHLGITRACIFSATIPIISAAASYLMGIETFSWVELAGIAIVIAGVILAQRNVRKEIA